MLHMRVSDDKLENVLSYLGYKPPHDLAYWRGHVAEVRTYFGEKLSAL
jgi:hypothetical protein